MGIEIHGNYDERYASVRDVFEDNFRKGREIGASFAATVDGRFVIDIWGGYADRNKTRSWNEDTIVNVWSATKVMASLCGWILADRGLLDFDAPVAKYWPEFGCNGKADLPVRCIFSHSSGLAGFSEVVKPEQLADWDYIVAMLAQQTPLWEPGTASGYHGLTMGYLIGEVVKRITGESIGQFFSKEVAIPLQTDFFIGVSPENDYRVAETIPETLLQPGDPGYQELDPDTIRGKVRLNQPLDHGFVNEISWRRAEIPAANGHGNAHAMARVAALLACGGELDGVKLLSMDTLKKVIEPQTDGADLVLNEHIRWGLGVELNVPQRPLSPNTRVFSWGGAGGSMIVVDLDARMSWAYAMNKMEDGPHFRDKRNRELSRAFYDILFK